MINKIRMRLVLGYTLAIIIILIAAIFAGHAALEYITIKTNEKSLITYLDTEVKEARDDFERWNKNKTIEPEFRTVISHKLAFNNIVYWVTPENSFLMAEELASNVSEQLREIVLSWDFPESKIKTLHITSSDSNNMWHFLLASKNVVKDGVYLGKIFVGINLTPLSRISIKYFNVALIIVFTVSILAFIIGNYFANNAVQPIEIAMQRQKEFIGNASHEIRTPLSILLSSVDLIDDNKNIKILNNMKSEILRMRDLVNNLLILTRMEDINDKRLFNNFNLSIMLDDIVKSMQIMATNKDISIETSIEKNISIYANEADIHNLITILIDNAIKYSPKSTKISIEAKKKNNLVRFIIKDQGYGIGEKDIEHIFDRFYRVDKAHSNSSGGFGLGLSLSSKIVSSHSGKIEVESTINKGSTFTIILPV